MRAYMLSLSRTMTRTMRPSVRLYIQYPKVKDPNLVGTYPSLTYSGAGYVWDAVLEHRVWVHPHRDPEYPEDLDGDDYYHAFSTFEAALEFSHKTPGSEEPLALVLQEEHINEPQPGIYVHVRKPRITEWCVEFLNCPPRNQNTIPDFMSAKAKNRVETTPQKNRIND